MREAQGALRRRQQAGHADSGSPQHYGSGGAFGWQQGSAAAAAAVPTGVPGVVHMVSSGGADGGGGVATYTAPSPAGPATGHHSGGRLHAAAAGGTGGDTSPVTATVTAPASQHVKGGVNLRRMPDLTAPDLLASDDGSEGGRKKKGGVFSRVFK
jgi:hypothetical protein